MIFLCHHKNSTLNNTYCLIFFFPDLSGAVIHSQSTSSLKKNHWMAKLMLTSEWQPDCGCCSQYIGGASVPFVTSQTVGFKSCSNSEPWKWACFPSQYPIPMSSRPLEASAVVRIGLILQLYTFNLQRGRKQTCSFPTATTTSSESLIISKAAASCLTTVALR